MRRYRGRAPTQICAVTLMGDVHLIETHEGGKYFLRNATPPKVGSDIYSLPFQRAQPMLFEQHGPHFDRIIDGDAWPFAEYPAALNDHTTRSLDEFERAVRKQFISDMARQNVIAKFRG